MPQDLSFDRPIDRRLVHRRSTSEVFPTDIQSIGPGTFQVALQWPRRHSYYSAMPFDSSLIVESIRQVTILTCHAGYGVPLGERFLMTGMGFVFADTAWPHPPLGEAAEIVVEVRGLDVRRAPRGRLRSVRVETRFNLGGVEIASGHGDALLTDDVTYRRMRGVRSRAIPPVAHHPRLIDHTSVGRTRQDDVHLASCEDGTLQIVVDGRHPIVFDHLIDHVPGVAVIEACRQATRLAAHDPALDFRAFEADFNRMIEFDESNQLSFEFAEGARFQVLQGGSVAVDASAVISPSLASVAAP